ncbi:MAG: ATP-binding cassette domain-containing protein [Spirochaetales bacterium]|nr:ATP-binding cassette domain-containing protein [Spirochaetales bacterium]
MSFACIEEVCHSFGSNRVLNALSLRLESGRFTVLAGRNGSGKTTAARLLNALVIPDKGRVIVDGFDSRDKASVFEIRKRIGLVLQNPENQIVADTVEDDVAFGPENLGLSSDEIRRRVDASLRAVGLYDKRLDNPSSLSGGQKQRLAIAGVLALGPKCIILDESLSMLDRPGRSEILKLLRRLCEEDGIAVLLITHDMEEAAYSDYVYVMDGGSVVMKGSAAEILTDERSLHLHGLRTPVACATASRLREKGYPVPQDVLTEEDLLSFIGGAAC